MANANAPELTTVDADEKLPSPSSLVVVEVPEVPEVVGVAPVLRGVEEEEVVAVREVVVVVVVFLVVVEVEEGIFDVSTSQSTQAGGASFSQKMPWKQLLEAAVGQRL